MCESLHNFSELKFLWKRRGNKNYDLKSFVIVDGTSVNYILFGDSQNRRYVFGKIVTDPREGEAYHWPRLQHENLAPLLDTVSINEKVSIYILPAIGFSLKTVIHKKEFMVDVESFNRKRAYACDILSALEYLHSKFLCVMNLTERIFYISDASDKAILYNFQCVHSIGKATKEDLDLPILYQAPELKTEYFDPISAETWACGVMFLQMFTNHALPSAFVGEDVQSVLQKSVKEINYDVIKEASPGADINVSMTEELKSFLDLFLIEDPKIRVHDEKAAASTFLKGTRRVEIKDNFKSTLWKSNEDTEFRKAFDKFSSHKKHIPSPFEDIYLKEVANCRNKLKQLPYTNKFINLKFIPQADSMTKHPAQNKSKKGGKIGISNKNKEKPIEPKHSPELDSGDKSSESRAGDNKINSSTSKIGDNFTPSCVLDNASNSNVETISNDFGDVTKSSPKHKEFYDSISDLHKIDDAIKSLENNESFNETEYSGTRFHKRSLSPHSDISLDSLEPLQNNLEQANDAYRERGFISHGSDKPSSCDSKPGTETEKIFYAEVGKSSRLKMVHVNSVFKIKNAFEQSLIKDRQSCSDQYVSSSTDVKDNNDDLDFSASIMNNNENICSNPEIERQHPIETLKLEVRVDEIQPLPQSNVSDDAMELDNQALEVKKDAPRNFETDFKAVKNEEVKTGGHFNFHESAKRDKTESVSLNNFQNVKQPDNKLWTNDSYKMAISNGLTDTIKHEIVPTTKETKLKIQKSMSIFKIPFIQKKTPNTVKNKEKDDIVKIEKIENVNKCEQEEPLVKMPEIDKKERRRKWFIHKNTSAIKKNKENDDNVKIENKENIKECVSMDSTGELSEIDKKQKKKRWLINLLCPGSK